MAKAKNRSKSSMRPVSIDPHFPTNADAGVMISMGETRVLCTASVSTDTPPWMRDADPPRGWVTAEYNMLPGSTPGRKRRKVDGRSTEIQRLISRVLRASVDLHKIPGVQITCDCDVITADGGTRTASITGAWVALARAINHAREDGIILKNPIYGPVSAISVGVIDQEIYLDLDYPLDSRAEVDMNVAMNHKGQFVEIQGTGEAGVFDRAQMDAMLDLAVSGCKKLFTAQRRALKA